MLESARNSRQSRINLKTNKKSCIPNANFKAYDVHEKYRDDQQLHMETKTEKNV